MKCYNLKNRIPSRNTQKKKKETHTHTHTKKYTNLYIIERQGISQYILLCP